MKKEGLHNKKRGREDGNFYGLTKLMERDHDNDAAVFWFSFLALFAFPSLSYLFS